MNWGKVLPLFPEKSVPILLPKMSVLPAVPITTVSTDFRVLPAFSAKNAVSDVFALTVISVSFVILCVPSMSLIPVAC